MKFNTKEQLLEALIVKTEERGIRDVDYFLNSTSVQELVETPSVQKAIKKTVELFGHIETIEQFYRAVDFFDTSSKFSVGICDNFFFAFDEETDFVLVETCFTLWDKFSGKFWYPVHTNKDVTPGEQYDIAFAEGSMYEGEYGQARFELFIHTMDCLKLLCE